MTQTTDTKAGNTEQRGACDRIIKQAAAAMIEEVGASTEMMLDRLLTYAGALGALADGSPTTAKMFREMAANIDGGCFHALTGESRDKAGRKH